MVLWCYGLETASSECSLRTAPNQRHGVPASWRRRESCWRVSGRIAQGVPRSAGRGLHLHASGFVSRHEEPFRAVGEKWRDVLVTPLDDHGLAQAL